MCKKSLLMMLLLALFAPWAANAQTSLWSEDFEDGDMPVGWTTDGSGTWQVGVGDYSAGTGAGHGSYNAKITHGTTGNVTKLITPEIDLSTVTSAELSFMHVQRSWAGDIDNLKVYYRTSSSGSWTQLVAYTAAVASWTTESGIILPNPSSTYQLAFEYIDNYGYGVGVDNIVIVQGASCVKPTALAVTPNGQSATLTWAGDASSFHVAYSADGTANPDDLTYTTVTTNSYTKDNLALDADHYFWVRANCSGTDQSAWAGPVSVHIGYCVPAPTSVDNNGISNVIFGIDDYVVNNETPKATYADYSNLVGAVRAGVEATIAITFKTGYTYNTYVWVDLDNSLSFDADEVVCYGESASSNPTTLTLNFTIPADQTLGDFRLRIGSADSGLGSDPTAANPCYTGTYGCFQDYTLRVLEAPSCLPPTGLAASDVTAHTANISWTSDGNAWLIGYSNDNFATEQYVDVTETSYTLTGLAPETAYQVRVQNNCGGGTYSVFTNPVSFTTTVACPAPTGLAAALTPGNGSVATLSWTSEASAWVVAYKTADATDFTEVNVTENPYTLTRLTPETTYNAKVKAVCGGEDGESSWSNTITFTPTNAYALTVNDGTSTNGLVPIYGTWVDNITKSQFIIPAENLADMAWGTINKMTFYAAADKNWGAAQFEVYMTETSETTLSALADYGTMTKVKNAGSLSISGNQMVVEFDTPYSYMGGNLMIGFLQTVSGSWSGCSWYGVSAEGASMGGYGSSINQQNFLPKTTFDYEPGEEPACMWPTNLAVSNVTAHTAELSWTSDADAWQIQVNEETPIDVTTNPYTLTGLAAETDYSVKVRANCGLEDGLSDWTAAVTFTTDVACPAPTNVAISNVEPFAATVNWEGTAANYNLRYRHAIDVDPSTPATIIIEAHDVWQDGSGYQMLFDADATAYGVLWNANHNILVDGETYSGGDLPAEYYDEFEYKIPTEADGSLNTTNIVMDGIVTITIPAGTYDYVILNPTPGDRFYIASDNGEVPCAGDDYVFEPGMTYHFTMQRFGSNDGAAFEIIPVMGDWTVVENATNPYALTNLIPETYYQVQVQAVCGGEDGVSKWTTVASFTTPSNCAAPTNLATNNITPNAATLSWEGFHDTYNVQYRTAESRVTYYFNDFNDEETPGWTRDYFIYGFTDPIYNVGGDDNYFLEMGWNSTEEETLISCELPAYESGAHVEFYYSGYQTANTFQVGFSTTTNDAEAFTWSDPIDAPLSTYTLYNEELADGIKYIAWKATASEQAACVFIDDFGIFGETIPASEWQTLNAVTTPYALTGLADGTEYEWQVQGINTACEGGVTSWSNMATFTTPDACQVPVIDSVTNIEATTATVYWTGIQESYNVRYSAFEPYSLITFDDEEIPADWTNDETYAWALTDTLTDGGYCIRSTNQGEASTTSTISFTAAFESAGVISFDAMFMGEGTSTYYDKCIFSIDGNQQFAYGQIGQTWYNMTYYFAAGRHTFTWTYSKDSSVNPTGDFFAIDNIKIQLQGDNWTTVENVTGNSYNMTGLTPETVIAVQVQGNNTVCDGGVTEWSEEYLFITPAYTQTLELSEGWNWVSIGIAVDDPVEMLDMLKASLGENATEIQSVDFTTEFDGEEWFGDLDEEGVYNEQMYLINAANDCTIELTGMPAVADEYEITINPGWNWIGFPSAVAIDVADALSDFDAAEGDEIQDVDNTTEFDGEDWFGDLETFEPGRGLLYNNTTDEIKTLIFRTGAKKAARHASHSFGTPKHNARFNAIITPINGNEKKTDRAVSDVKTKSTDGNRTK